MIKNTCYSKVKNECDQNLQEITVLLYHVYSYMCFARFIKSRKTEKRKRKTLIYQTFIEILGMIVDTLLKN